MDPSAARRAVTIILEQLRTQLITVTDARAAIRAILQDKDDGDT